MVVKATRSQIATARALVGRRIQSVELNPFDPTNGQPAATDPAIYLDDGGALFFTVQETDTGEYGIELGLHRGTRERVVVSLTRTQLAAVRCLVDAGVEDEPDNRPLAAASAAMRAASSRPRPGHLAPASASKRRPVGSDID